MGGNEPEASGKVVPEMDDSTSLINHSASNDTFVQENPIPVDRKTTISPEIHDNLSEEQLNAIKLIHSTFEEVYHISLKEMISNFKRDKNMESNIVDWMHMAEIYAAFSKKRPGTENFPFREEAYRLILYRSMMEEEEAISNTNVSYLSEQEVRFLMSSYKLEAKPI